MVQTVVREHHWQPNQINRLYLDDIDYNGLEFWYNDVVAVGKELKTKQKK
jgi:hypothetical protein